MTQHRRSASPDPSLPPQEPAAHWGYPPAWLELRRVSSGHNTRQVDIHSGSVASSASVKLIPSSCCSGCVASLGASPAFEWPAVGGNDETLRGQERAGAGEVAEEGSGAGISCSSMSFGAVPGWPKSGTVCWTDSGIGAPIRRGSSPVEKQEKVFRHLKRPILIDRRCEKLD